MDETLLLLKHVQSRNKAGKFLDIEYYLEARGFDDFASKNRFVKDLNKIGYILSNPVYRHDPRAIEHQSGLQSDHPDYKVYPFDVQITVTGGQYLIENERIEMSLRATKRANLAASISALIAFIALGLNILQYRKADEMDTRISKQDSIIRKLEVQLSSLSTQNEAVSNASPLKGHKK